MTSYYGNINPDLLARIPLTAARVLEIGCGAGNLARAYLARNPGADYVGVELFPDAARQARECLRHVVVGDIEQPAVLAELDQARADEPFDVLIFGDVLEHLRDPWQTLAELRRRVAPGGLCLACIPNVAHWSVLQQLLRGRWDYAEAGLLDRTHMRFFTRATSLELFQQAGWSPLEAKARVLWPENTEAAVGMFAPLAAALEVPPDQLRRDLSALQWVVRAVNGPNPQVLSVVGVGLKNFAGIHEARLGHPLAALASLPTARAVSGAGGVRFPSGWGPGVLVLHRQFMTEPAFIDHMERRIAQGWVVVTDMDDDPHHWKEFAASDFRAYRGVHAVTVSTEPLAEMMRQWNPHVRVFPNAILELPRVPATTPKQGQRLRLFFGALNRRKDWEPIQAAMLEASRQLGERVEWVVVHDRAVFDALPATLEKTFHPTLAHDQYMEVLASCDVALLPLLDTPFNRLKSDIKFIECCAAGVVPICSPVVYGERAEHGRIGVLAETPEQWARALLDLCGDLAGLEQRRRMGLDYVRRERMHVHQVGAREAYYRGLLADRTRLEAERKGRLASMTG